MSLKDSVKKAANAAGIAAATTGLSTCQNSCGTVVDPAPPPLICTDVALGQSLQPSATNLRAAVRSGSSCGSPLPSNAIMTTDVL